MSKQKYTNNELYILMENIEKKLDSGFLGVYKRQDITNGNVKRNTEFRVGVQANIKMLKWVVGILAAIDVVALIKIFS